MLPENSRLFGWLLKTFHTGEFVCRHGRWPADPSRDFNSFLFARKVDRTLAEPLRRTVTDKEYGKDFIESRLGRGRTIETVCVLRSEAEIVGFMPFAFPVVVKPTHSSGRTRVIHRSADYEAAVPMMKRWLRHSFFRQSLELNYRGLEKKVIVERYLPDAFGHEGSIHFRAGRPRVISIIDRFSPDKRRASYDAEWRSIEVALGQPYRPMPSLHLTYREQLLVEASALAAPFDYIRVDFYGSASEFVFGELTNLPAGGLGRFDPPDGEARFNAAFFGL